MTHGVLLFAIDTDSRSYTKMAIYCAKKIKKYLNLPVTLVTDTNMSHSIFDNVINIESVDAQRREISNSGVIEQWNNFGRYRAYELSPYDTTLLLDTDYICGSNQLLKLFDFNHDFMCHKNRVYLGNQIMSNNIELFGNNIEMYWATVVKFTKSVESKCVFDMMKMIQENYNHYSRLYKFKLSPYRNDYSLSIALNTVYGHIIPKEVEIPWKLMNVEFTTDIKYKDQTSWQLEFDKTNDGQTKRFKITTHKQDLHMLNKDALFKIIENNK